MGNLTIVYTLQLANSNRPTYSLNFYQDRPNGIEVIQTYVCKQLNIGKFEINLYFSTI